jgi:hypothetical protein
VVHPATLGCGPEICLDDIGMVAHLLRGTASYFATKFTTTTLSETDITRLM